MHSRFTATEDSIPRHVITGHQTLSSCKVAAVSPKGCTGSSPVDRTGSLAKPDSVPQHVCAHHVKLPYDCQTAPSQQRRDACIAYLAEPMQRTQELSDACQAEPAQQKRGVCSTPQSQPMQQRQELCSACLQPQHRHSSPTRAAATQASRAIKQSFGHGSASSSSAAGMPDVLPSEVLLAEPSLCSNRYSAADAQSMHVRAASSQRECCHDCGYVTRSPGSDITYKLGTRPASAGGCRAATPVAIRPSSADVNKAGRAAGQRACAGCLHQPLHSHSQGRAVALTPVLKGQQESKSPLSQLQQSFRAELGPPSSTAASLSAAASEAHQGHLKTSSTPSNHSPLERTAEVVHSAKAADQSVVHESASSHSQGYPEELSPETSFLQMLDQCHSSATVLPASPRMQQLEQQQQQQQTETLSVSIADMPACAAHAGYQAQQPMRLQNWQQVKTSLPRSSSVQPEATAVAPPAEPASTAVAARRTEAHSSGMIAGVSDCSRGGNSAVSAAWRPEHHDELCQLRAIVADRTQLTKPQQVAQVAKSSRNYELQLMSACSVCPAPAMPADPVAMTAFPAAGSPAAHASVPDDNSHTCASRQAESNCQNADQPVLQDSSRTPAPSVISRDQLLPVSPADSDGLQQVSSGHNAAEQPVLNTLPSIAHNTYSRSPDLPVYSAVTETDARQQQERSFHAETGRRDAGTDAMVSSMETDHRRLLPGTAWVEQRHWITARRQSGRMDAKWELDESGSDSGDSEGSVSTESTLRPSSVGRCRVNSGRHAKVLLQI